MTFFAIQGIQCSYLTGVRVAILIWQGNDFSHQRRGTDATQIGQLHFEAAEAVVLIAETLVAHNQTFEAIIITL